MVPSLKARLANLKEFIVENEKTARKFLKEAEIVSPQSELIIREYGKHNKEALSVYFKSLEEGFDVGLLSEAGCPAIADPGAEIVLEAHKRHIQVIPFVGASSIILGLMASGFNGQSFCFQGYLPFDRPQKKIKIKFLEAESLRLNQTQIFIETPYRNRQLLEELVLNLQHDTFLCVAAGLTTANEYIYSAKIGEWKGKLPELNKIPAIFLIYRPK